MDSLEEYRQVAIAKGKTNDQGVVVFENIVSSDNDYYYYRVIAYDDNEQTRIEDSIYLNEASKSYTFGGYWWED